jgi:hypothetical protein
MYIKKRLPVFLWVLFALSCVGTSGLYAKYVMDIDTDISVNISSKGDIEIAVEKIDDSTFTIKNVSTAETPAYIRFAVIVNWADENGNLYYINPTTVGLSVADKPFGDLCTKLEKDGYYYYNGTVSAGAEIPKIYVTVGSSAPPGYTHRRITVLAEGIQCWPEAVVKDAWNATFNGTIWEAKP